MLETPLDMNMLVKVRSTRKAGRARAQLTWIALALICSHHNSPSGLTQIEEDLTRFIEKPVIYTGFHQQHCIDTAKQLRLLHLALALQTETLSWIGYLALLFVAHLLFLRAMQQACKLSNRMYVARARNHKPIGGLSGMKYLA